MIFGKQQLLYACFGWCLLAASEAIAGTVYIARDKRIEAESEPVIDALSRAFTRLRPQLEVKLVYSSDVGGESGSVIVAVGEAALQELIRGQGDSAVVSAFVSRSTFYSVIDQYPAQRARVAAVFSDPSPIRQLALSRVLFGEGASIGFLETPDSARDVRESTEQAKQFGLRISVANVNQVTSVKDLFDRIKFSNGILLFRDKELFDIYPLDELIREAYDNRGMGVIGFSSVIVNNGGLATTFSNSEDTSDHVASMVYEVLEKNIIPKDSYPKKYNVSVNKYVLRSLGYRAIGEDEIRKQMTSLLKEEIP